MAEFRERPGLLRAHWSVGAGHVTHAWSRAPLPCVLQCNTRTNNNRHRTPLFLFFFLNYIIIIIIQGKTGNTGKRTRFGNFSRSLGILISLIHQSTSKTTFSNKTETNLTISREREREREEQNWLTTGETKFNQTFGACNGKRDKEISWRPTRWATSHCQHTSDQANFRTTYFLLKS